MKTTKNNKPIQHKRMLEENKGKIFIVSERRYVDKSEC